MRVFNSLFNQLCIVLEKEEDKIWHVANVMHMAGWSNLYKLFRKEQLIDKIQFKLGFQPEKYNFTITQGVVIGLN